VPRGELFEDADEKNKSHLRNFKLKFSRLLTCFSMVLPLYLSQERLEPSTIAALVGETPLHRIRQASGKCPESRELWERIEMDYSWFLSKTGKPRAEVIGWIGDPSVRGSAFERAKAFGDAIFELLSENIEPGSLRYLVV
jgi:hypothetical protein